MLTDARLGWLAVGLALASAVLAGVPYLTIDAGAVGTYYRGGPIGPPLAALFGVIAAIAVLAGVRGRTDPAVASGIGVVFGLASGLGALWWSLGVSPALVGGLTEHAIVRWHRWAVLGATAGVAIIAGWYARRVI